MFGVISIISQPQQKHCLSLKMLIDLKGSTNFDTVKSLILAIQYYQNSIISSPILLLNTQIRPNVCQMSGFDHSY